MEANLNNEKSFHHATTMISSCKNEKDTHIIKSDITDLILNSYSSLKTSTIRTKDKLPFHMELDREFMERLAKQS